MTIQGEKRFEFGKNWQSYSQLVDESRIEAAVARMSRMFGSESLHDKTFLDIGCGSGLHSLAAQRLGVRQVRALDLDGNSVQATLSLLNRFGVAGLAQVDERSVFDLDPRRDGRFEIVYSWGVLHHTGDMKRAIVAAARMVNPGGILALALYGRTPFCGMWTRIKRWYVSASAQQQVWAERLYIRLFGFYLLLRGRRLSTHMRNYRNKRGMEFVHDVRDWIGGYPYESIRPEELDGLLRPLGFRCVGASIKRRSGLFGSGCDEYLYRCDLSS